MGRKLIRPSSGSAQVVDCQQHVERFTRKNGAAKEQHGACVEIPYGANIQPRKSCGRSVGTKQSAEPTSAIDIQSRFEQWHVVGLSICTLHCSAAKCGKTRQIGAHRQAQNKPGTSMLESSVGPAYRRNRRACHVDSGQRQATATWVPRGEGAFHSWSESSPVEPGEGQMGNVG